MRRPQALAVQGSRIPGRRGGFLFSYRFLFGCALRKFEELLAKGASVALCLCRPGVLAVHPCSEQHIPAALPVPEAWGRGLLILKVKKSIIGLPALAFPRSSWTDRATRSRLHAREGKVNSQNHRQVRVPLLRTWSACLGTERSHNDVLLDSVVWQWCASVQDALRVEGCGAPAEHVCGDLN